MLLPVIIQGGMGVAVSGWMLARTVSQLGQLGVVSGTALGVVVARRLQCGDPGGHIRRAIEHFPLPEMAARVLRNHYIEGGKGAEAPFRLTAMPTVKMNPALLELTVVANFAEVYLAKEGHSGLVGINYLEKIQIPTLPSIFGAMLAGVDYVLMGAGIPRYIPGVLDRLATGEDVDFRLDVEDALPGEEYRSCFSPREFWQGTPPTLRRPQFLGIVSSATLAMTLAKKASGRVDGFVVEGDTAGGHNAPPRGPLQLSAIGEPVYGPRDIPDFEKIRALGLPFWLAGSYGQPGRLQDARRLGAAGVQVGTAFAFCEESGIEPSLKAQVLAMVREGTARAFTDPLASPTGFPFKVVPMPGTLSEPSTYQQRGRICDLGYLRHLYRKTDGSLGYRCPAEPVDDYVQKGGKIEDTAGRKCICNALPAAAGFPQYRSDSGNELAVLTSGNDVAHLGRYLKPGRETYTAAEVVTALLAGGE